MAWLIAILTAVLRVLLPELLKKRPPTSEEGARRPELRGRLNDRIREKWGPRAVALVLGVAFTVAFVLGGCTQVRTVYVPHGEPVRLRETLKDVEIWAVDSKGTPTAGVMDLPEGWFCLPDPRADNE